MSKSNRKWAVAVAYMTFDGINTITKYEEMFLESEEAARNIYNTLKESANMENYEEIFLEYNSGIEDHYSNTYWKREDE